MNGWAAFNTLVATTQAASTQNSPNKETMTAPSEGHRDDPDTQRQLEVAYDRFRTLTEHAFDLIAEIDEHGVYRYLSPNHRTVLGWDIDALLGQNSLDVIHPSQRQFIEDRLKLAVQEGSGSAEVQIRTAGGEWRWMESTGQIYRTADGEPRFVLISRDVTARKEAEARVQREQDFQRRLVALLDCERRLMAFEIHDGLVQDLFGAQLFLESIDTKSFANLEEVSIYESALRLLRGSIEEARRLINGLRPPILDERGLIPALEHLAEDMGQNYGLDVDFTADVEFERLSPAIENSIYRIVQESLHNVRKHSGVDSATVTIRQHDGRIHLAIEDEGQGFDPTNIPEKHYGVQGIHERARLLEGESRIESQPGQGTRVFVSLPLIAVEDPRAGRHPSGEC